MNTKLNEVNALIAEGTQFTFKNFSTKSDRGYPIAFTPEWISWITRAKVYVLRVSGEESPAMEMIRTGLNVQLIGNGRHKFEESKAYLIGALQAISDQLSSWEQTESDASEFDSQGVEQTRQVFIVHGHDTESKTELELLLAEMGLEPVVLHRQPDEGQTIIEKFEKHASVGFAFILLTPDEVAYLAADANQPEAERQTEMRARPNVIFEFGYFVGRLGRSRVCCLYTGDVSLPSDVSGLIYKRFERSVEEVAYSITRELKAAGYALS